MAKKQSTPKSGSDVYAGYSKTQDDFSAAPAGGIATPAKVRTDGSIKRSKAKPVIGSKGGK